uniref:Uncharacterized protein n=1 Tax=Romanomermis culicivorax TaxID=13658 RepID=A0A915L665_ROMCU
MIKTTPTPLLNFFTDPDFLELTSCALARQMYKFDPQHICNLPLDTFDSRCEYTVLAKKSSLRKCSGVGSEIYRKMTIPSSKMGRKMVNCTCQLVNRNTVCEQKKIFAAGCGMGTMDQKLCKRIYSGTIDENTPHLLTTLQCVVYAYAIVFRMAQETETTFDVVARLIVGESETESHDQSREENE